MKKLFALACVACVMMLVSCAPMSKEGYMDRYEAFMEEVAENYSTYTPEQWADKTEEFDLLSGEWYHKFKNEMSFREKVIVGAYQVKYAYYYSLGEAQKVVNGLTEDEQLQEWKDQAKEYINNDMEDDLKDLMEEVSNAGVEAQKFIEDIADELEANSEDFQDMIDDASKKLEEQFN